MRRRWFFPLLAVVMSSSLLLTGCGLTGGAMGTGEKAGDKEQVLDMTLEAEPPGLDSAVTTDVISFDVLNNVMEGLYRLDKDNRPEPGIASGVEISEDKKTYTFRLRDSKWSDDEPVKAQDFEYAWKRALDPKTKGEYAYILYPIKNAEAYNSGQVSIDEVGIKSVDEHTLQVELEYPIPYFLGLTTFATYLPQRKDIVEKFGTKYATEPENMVYNGPFQLKEWQHEQKIQLQKSDTYWDRNSVRLETVNQFIVKDTATGVNLYTSDQTDITHLDSELSEAFKKSPEYMPVTQSTVQYLQFNTNNEFLSNANIRKAISYAIDRESLVKVLKDGSEPAYGFVSPTIINSDNKNFRKEAGDGHQFNPPEAQRLLKLGMEELGITEKPKLTMLIYDDKRKRAAEVMQEELRNNLGLDVRLDPRPLKQKLDEESKGNFEITFAGWSADYNDPMSYLDMFLTDGPFNRGKWSHKTYDQLIKKSAGNPDNKKRAKDLIQAEKILDQSAPIAPMYFGGEIYLQKQYVKNIVRHPIGTSISLKWAYMDGKEKKK
ncbi:oligopeptide transport system substrate-binding protein [Kroppenstedtia sanguinis]|uniref:Peptide ABC transporter substrate-binding protein n=1 Tax=Kroppenstedtia sanguinis TaxID=1380684 RepID=A0ABW4C8C2_9BACL